MKNNETEQRTGLVVVITGSGKGKSTAAFGIALRAAGHALRICIIGFLKGPSDAGEYASAALLTGVEVHAMGKGFCGIMRNDLPIAEHRQAAQDALRMAKEKISSDEFDVVILDEINVALGLGLLDLHQVLSLINEKPPPLHLVLTGRQAHPDVIARADTATEMLEIKHALGQGIEPQKGIDY